MNKHKELHITSTGAEVRRLIDNYHQRHLKMLPHSVLEAFWTRAAKAAGDGDMLESQRTARLARKASKAKENRKRRKETIVHRV